MSPIYVPAIDADFMRSVVNAGFVDVTLEIEVRDGRELLAFYLSTDVASDTTVQLYSSARPERRMFRTIHALSAALRRFGVHHATLPLVPGSVRCKVRAPEGVPLASGSFPDGSRECRQPASNRSSKRTD